MAVLLAKLETDLARVGDRRPLDFRSQIIGALPTLRCYAMSLTGSAALTEDLVQETVIGAWAVQDPR